MRAAQKSPSLIITRFFACGARAAKILNSKQVLFPFAVEFTKSIPTLCRLGSSAFCGWKSA